LLAILTHVAPSWRPVLNPQHKWREWLEVSLPKDQLVYFLDLRTVSGVACRRGRPRAAELALPKQLV